MSRQVKERETGMVQTSILAVFSVLLSLPSLVLLVAAQRYLRSEYVAAGLGRV